MLRYCFIYVVMSLMLYACKIAKPTSKAPILNVSTFDSFTSTDLFFLPPEKQLAIYQSVEKVLPTGLVKAGTKKYPLSKARDDFGSFSFVFRDTLRTLKDFMTQTKIVGLIMVKDSMILLERYRDGTGPNTKWVSFSVAKSVTSLLYGAALHDGSIKSLDERVPRYIPQLAGSAYDSVSLRHLLQMSSGVEWNDDPRDRASDLMKIAPIQNQQGFDGVYQYLSRLPRKAPAGTLFNYNTVETALAGMILRNAIGKPLSLYLSEKIWKPFGMHQDANWLKITNTEIENGGCCISATLRDYALLGLLALRNGIAPDGKQLLPPNWMYESTSPTRPFNGYGYYWWLRPNGRYYASGAFGQQIEVDPYQKTVIAIQSYWPVAFNNYYTDYIDEFIDAILQEQKRKIKNEP